MLPDFPELKRGVLQEALATMRRLIHEKHPVLAQIRGHTQHEGRAMRYEQVGYGEKEEDLQHQSFPIEIRFDEVPTLNGQKLHAKMEALANEVGKRQMETLFAKHDEATRMTGNRIDAAGQQMNGSLLLQMVEGMPIDFDSDGNILVTSTLLTHPTMEASYRAALKEIDDDPSLQSRYRLHIGRQYDNWLDREDRRKLVD